MSGLMSGVAYGAYTVLIMLAGETEPLAAYAGLWAASYVCAGLNDLFAGIWLGIYHIFKDRGDGIRKTLTTPYGKRVLVGALLGGPVANGLYLTGLSLAGVYAIPISATCGLFGALMDWILFHHKPGKKVFAGMVFCVAGAVLVNWTSSAAGSGFLKGIVFAILAAFFWGCEGVFSGSGDKDADPGSAANIREILSGLTDLLIMLPILGGVPLLVNVVKTGVPVVWLGFSGLMAAISYFCWYRSNALIGCASGMSLNITYVFWGVFFCVLFLGQPVSVWMAAGTLLIIIGSMLVAK